MRRIAIALAVVGSLLLSVPGTASADTQCGLLVCADAASDARWDCEVFSMGTGFGFAQCFGSGSGVAGGRSDLTIPGSANWAVAATCTFVASGNDFPCGSGTEGPHLCTWAGLGENGCGGSFSSDRFGPFGFGLTPGQCVGDVADPDTFDVVIRTAAEATATKSLLVLGPLDSATAYEESQASLSDVPDGPTTCLPEG